MLRNFVRVTKGEHVTIDVMELDNSSPTRFWRWATDVDGGERPLVSQTMHQCRLVFVAESGPSDHFDFLALWDDRTRPFSLIDEHHFVYARKWRNEDAKEL